MITITLNATCQQPTMIPRNNDTLKEIIQQITASYGICNV